MLENLVYNIEAVWRKRGGDSYDTEQVTSSFALVRALPMPPPAAKPPGVRRKRAKKTVWDNDEKNCKLVKKTSINRSERSIKKKKHEY